jgi:hypothetical protein
LVLVSAGRAATSRGALGRHRHRHSPTRC